MSCKKAGDVAILMLRGSFLEGIPPKYYPSRVIQFCIDSLRLLEFSFKLRSYRILTILHIQYLVSMNAWENVLLQGLMPALHNQKCTPKPSALHAPGDAYPVCIIRHQLIRLYDYRTGGLPPIIMLLRISQCFHRRLVKPRKYAI